MESNVIALAKQTATLAHQHQTRDDGEPYINHPERVVNKLIDIGIQDTNIIAAAWLHDTVEDTNVTLEQILNEFGPEIADIVDELTLFLPTYPKDFPVQHRRSLKTYALIGKSVFMSDQAKIIKLSDRLDNLISSDNTTRPWRPDRIISYSEQAILIVRAMNTIPVSYSFNKMFNTLKNEVSKTSLFLLEKYKGNK